MIFIINYGIGNIYSIKNMLLRMKCDVEITDQKDNIQHADKLILPGVGNFDYGMKKLQESNLIPILEKKIFVEKIPVLGICLGAQLMTKRSDEGQEKGLGWINGETVAFDNSKFSNNEKIPHMAWNYVKAKKGCDLFNDMPQESRFYFVHSYHLKMNNPEDIWLTSNYGYEFCAAYQHENIFATQFHPEKSHKFGMKLLENFAKL